MAGRNGISKVAMKAMGLFGGVQIVGILCSILRTKLVALWIGPVGVGLFALFNQALEMISTATNLGIRQSSVRDLSQSAERAGGDGSFVSRMIVTVRRWSLWLGLLGATLTVVLAPVLSQWTFGDRSHLWGFVALSVAIFLVTLTNGEYAIFQGLAKLRRLAHVTIWGTLFGLVISIPLFYYLREKSILPSFIAYAFGNALFAFLFRHRDFTPVKVTAAATFELGKGFVKFGIFMTIGNFVTILAGYAFNAWLNMHAGTHEVGLYQAGYTMVYKYTGLVLTALGMEYYPRLARVAHSKVRLRAFVSQEINIVMMVMAPIAALFILLREPIVWLLYSGDFLVIVTFASWIMVGTVFRALSWCIAFVILAKGSGTIYLVTESISAVVELVLNISFYHLWGLTGLGISYVVWYVIYTLIVWIVYRYTYRLSLVPASLFNLGWAFFIAVAVLLVMDMGAWIVGAGLTLLSLAVCAFQAKKQFFR